MPHHGLHHIILTLTKLHIWLSTENHLNGLTASCKNGSTKIRHNSVVTCKLSWFCYLRICTVHTLRLLSVLTPILSAVLWTYEKWTMRMLRLVHWIKTARWYKNKCTIARTQSQYIKVKKPAMHVAQHFWLRCSCCITQPTHIEYIAERWEYNEQKRAKT